MTKLKAFTERHVRDVDAVLDPNPMDQFKKLARKIVNVPRPELEEKIRQARKRSRHEGEKPE